MIASKQRSHKRVDFHVHSKISKRLRFSLQDFGGIVTQALRTGLDAFVLTEHFRFPDFWSIYDALCHVYRYDDGVLELDDGFRILTGAELGVAEGCDLLLMGTLSQLSAFSQRLPASPVTGYKPSFAEAVRVARLCGLVLIGAHMFRPEKELGKLGGTQLASLDALELNGKDFVHDGAVRVEAERLRLPVVGGSDAHFWLQVGIKATSLPIEEVTHRSVAQAVAAGAGTVYGLAYGPMAVQVSSAYKRFLKVRRKRAA